MRPFGSVRIETGRRRSLRPRMCREIVQVGATDRSSVDRYRRLAVDADEQMHVISLAAGAGFDPLTLACHLALWPRSGMSHRSGSLPS